MEFETTSVESPLMVVEEILATGVKFKKDEILVELKKQVLLAGPLASVNFSIYFLQVISLMFVGHFGELPLAGASMATSFASVMGFTLLKGMGSALDTFCGQSYGAEQYNMLGIHLQRAMIVLLLVSIPLAFMWGYTTHILLFFGQDPEISIEAGLYIRFMIPSIFGFAIQECYIRFLQAQNIVVPMMISSGITTLFHFVLCWVLVLKSELGHKGAALANTFSCWINALILMLYVTISPSCKKTWTGFSKEALNLHGITIFLKLAISSAIMITVELWSFEMVVLLSGLLPNPKLETSVLSISLNICLMVYMIPLGLSGAISTRVSNELGAGQPRTARLAVCVVVFIAAAEAVVAGSIMVAGRKVWGYLYSKEEEVVKYLGDMVLIVAVAHFFDSMQCVLSGTARGCGRQKIGAYANLGAYYLIGIPCAILLAFVYQFGGKGLWTGIIVALIVQVLVLSIITLSTNWEKEARNATLRAHSEKNHEDVLEYDDV